MLSHLCHQASREGEKEGGIQKLATGKGKPAFYLYEIVFYLCELLAQGQNSTLSKTRPANILVQSVVWQPVINYLLEKRKHSVSEIQVFVYTLRDMLYANLEAD